MNNREKDRGKDRKREGRKKQGLGTEGEREHEYG